MACQIVSELFDLRKIEYNIRPQTDFSLGAVCTANYGLQSIIYFAQKIWNMIPADIRNNLGYLMLVLVIYPGVTSHFVITVALCNTRRTL